MALRARVEYLRREHKGLLKLVERMEAALALASQEDIAKREDSLARLRALEAGFHGIAEHCHAEERIVESTYHAHASKKERVKNDEQHRQILQKLGAFRDELQFATVDRLHDVCVSGNDLAGMLRTHVTDESKVLDRIARKAQPSRKRKPIRAAKQTSRVTLPGARSARERAHAGPGISYLMEDHPEL